MKKAVATNSTAYTFKYNETGIRTEKNTTSYVNNGNLMVAEYNSQTGLLLNYLFDENETRIGFDICGSATLNNKTRYYYVFNVQGGVVGTIIASGILFAKYDYNA